MPRQEPRLSEGRMTKQFKRMLRADRERFLEKLRRAMVLGLANLPDDSCGYFRKRFKVLMPGVDDSALLQHREQLRKFWSGDDRYRDSRPELFRFDLLHSWLEQARRSSQHLWVVGTYGDGTCSVQPNWGLLPLSLALAASELTVVMGICGNPECPQKYFLKGRSTQQFCDLSACSAYGQKQHKLKWWEAHKSELRSKANAKKRSKNDRRN